MAINDDFSPENDNGNIEYKWKLLDLSSKRVDQLITQMQYRLNEGSGEAFYEIGIKDDGFPIGISENEFIESSNNLKKIANECNAIISLVSKKEIKNGKIIAEYLVRENNDNNKYIDISILVAGNVDAGKSSTIGVLISGKNDNGRGLSRINVFNFKHELESGRTSSIAHQIIGFDNSGKLVNDNTLRKLSWPEIIEDSSKVITFYDLAGHEKYLRTTIFGFSSTYSDYAMILVGANMGITHMTKEHISLCLSYKVPFFILITKIDICPKEVYEETKKNIKNILSSTGLRKLSLDVKNEEDVVLASKNILNDNFVPIFSISNVSGENLNLLKKFLNLLPQRKDLKQYDKEPIDFSIDNKYIVTGCGTVVSGILLKGTVKVNDNVLIGPDTNGNYKKTQIKSIHCKRVPMNMVKAGSYTCFCLKKISKQWVRKGMVIIGEIDKPNFIWRFDAEVSILRANHTTIVKGYEPILHVNNISQVSIIKNITNKITRNKKNIDTDQVVLRAGDKALVTFEFKYRPEYIKENQRIVFREHNLRGVGIIKKIYNGKK